MLNYDKYLTTKSNGGLDYDKFLKVDTPSIFDKRTIFDDDTSFKMPSQIKRGALPKEKKVLSPELSQKIEELPTFKEQVKSYGSALGGLFKGESSLFRKGARLGTDISKVDTAIKSIPEEERQLSQEAMTYRQAKDLPGIYGYESAFFPQVKYKGQPTPFEVAQESDPLKYGIGQGAGELSKYAGLYSVAGPAISKLATKAIPALGSATTPLGKLGAELVIEGIKDLIISTPLTTIEASQSGLKGKELRDYMLKQMAIDVAANGIMYYGGKALSKLKAKQVTKAVDESVEQVLKGDIELPKNQYDIPSTAKGGIDVKGVESKPIFKNGIEQVNIKNINQSHSSFRGAPDGQPMSDWGHAMFVDDIDRAYFDEFSNNKGYFVDKGELIDENKTLKILEKEWEYSQKNDIFDEYDINDDIKNSSFEEIKETFLPTDIVDSAEAYDNQGVMLWFYENVIEPNNIKGVNTPDGSIVFDKSIIKQISDTELPTKPLDAFPPSTLQKPQIETKALTQNKFKSSTQDVTSGKPKRRTAKQVINDIYTKNIDDTHPLKQISDEVQTTALNNKKSGGTVEYMLKDNMIGADYKDKGDSLKNVLKDLSPDNTKEFSEYVYNKHNIARARQGKPIYGDLSIEDSIANVKYLEKKNTNFKAISEKLNQYYNTLGEEWLVKSGLVDADFYKRLKEMYPDYVFTKRNVESFDTGRAKGVVDTGKGIQKIRGAGEDLVDVVENTISYTNSIVKTATNNKVGQQIVDVIQKNPEQYVDLIKIVETSPEAIKAVDDAIKGNDLEKLVELTGSPKSFKTNGTNIVTVLQDGKPIQLEIKDKTLYDFLTNANATKKADIEKLLKKVTGAFKSVITQENPFFAVRNIARDIPTAFVFGSEKNPFKFTNDLKKALKDIKNNNETFRLYKAKGGAGANFVSKANTFKQADDLLKEKNLFKKLTSGLSSFNNVTETVPRFAEFKRVLERTGDLDKALRASSEVTVDFSRGGKNVKQIDAGVPYLNASVQGLDKIARELIQHPFKTTSKGLLAIGAPTVALYLINKDNPNYQDFNNRQKDNYFNIPIPWETDENGDVNKFLKIPKSRELGVLFGSFFERIGRQIEDKSNAFKGFGNTVATNFSPANPLDSSIFQPILNLKSNKDFADRTIVPQGLQNRSPELQYDERTSELGKQIGKLIKASPKQIDYLIDSYTGVIGDFLLPATTKTGSVGDMVSRQFISDPLYSNQSITDFYDYKKEITTKATDKNVLENLPSSAFTKEEEIKSRFTKASSNISKLYDMITQIESSELSDEEKETNSREVRKEIIKIAKSINAWYESIREK